MQWSLFLLLLMGQCSFFMCHLHEYHFVKEKKTWTEAQQYCREHHTDLATVSDMTDMERLRDSAQNHDGAWIGLYSTAGEDNRMWHWSLPGVEFSVTNTKWAPGEPNDVDSPENCVRIRNNLWLDSHCTRLMSAFICYDERKQSNKTFHLIEDRMSWPQAQSYCREHHTDLVSGDQQLEDDEFKTEIKSDREVWIGLFRDSWRWSDGSNHSFRYWDLESDNDKDHNQCATTKLNGKWRAARCEEEKPFFCYNVSSMADKMILIKENLTWDNALKYCRVNHCDLVSITNPDEQRWVQEEAKKANSPYVWLGLRYTCTLDFWFWIDDKTVTYKNWGADVPADDCDMSGAMDRGGEHKWFKKNDNEKFNFICSTC